MAKRVPTILLACLILAVAFLARQVMTLQSSIAELRDQVELAKQEMPAAQAPDREMQFDYDSALRLWEEQSERIVPISDPSIERAMQADRLRKSVPRDRSGQELRVEPAPSPSEAEAFRQFIDQLPEAEK